LIRGVGRVHTDMEEGVGIGVGVGIGLMLTLLGIVEIGNVDEIFVICVFGFEGVGAGGVWRS